MAEKQVEMVARVYDLFSDIGESLGQVTAHEAGEHILDIEKSGWTREDLQQLGRALQAIPEEPSTP